MPKYKNPPIVEALCEFQFIEKEPFDNTIPGLFYKEIQERYPKKIEQKGLSFAVNPKEGKIVPGVEMLGRMQFFNKDNTSLIQIGPNLLAVNFLKPYPGWEVFKPQIIKHLDIYKKLIPPAGFKRIGLRYIDKIEIPLINNSIAIEDYFKLAPSYPPGLGAHYDSVSIRMEFPYEGGRDKLIVALTSATPEKEGFGAFILDMDYFISSNDKIDIVEQEWIENAHANIESAFESIIADKCRSIFEVI